MRDVTILGGGPVGTFLSVVLSDMGVTNTVIDRDLVPYQLPRAIVMDDEIQRAFHDHGLGEWLTANTEPLQRGDFVAFLDTGGYTESSAARYNAQLLPATVLVTGDHAEITTEREQLKDVAGRFRVPAHLLAASFARAE